MSSFDEPGTAEGYEYRPLPGRDHIRYLSLAPGDYMSPIHCSLQTGPLDHMPYFEAISYVWGSSQRNFPILCDGATMYITRNLRDVLRQVRSHSRPRTIWADSICINQQDVAEKGIQVAMMGQLYSRADRVLICLGLEDDTGCADRVASLIADIDSMIQKELARLNGSRNTFPFLEDDDPIIQDERWSFLRELLEEPWFERGWTVQEAALANDARILWGKVEIDWRTLLRLCWWIKCRATQLSGKWHLFGLPNHHMMRYQNRYKLEATTIDGWIAENPDFLIYVDLARSLKLFDPRDRIYAFLGFGGEHSAYDPTITPDYQKSAEAVYVEFAWDYIEKTKSASILHFIEHDESTIGMDNLASWVPNWTTYAHHEDLSSHSSEQLILHPSLSEFSPKMDNHGNLRVRAAIVDTVRYASGKLHWNSTALSEVVSIWTEISAMDETVPYTTVTPLEIFATILTTGQFRTREKQCHMFAYMLRLHDGATPGSAGEVTPDQVDNMKSKSHGGNLLLHHDRVRALGHNRRVIMTQRGFYGLAPGIVQKGDLCAFIFGGTQTPFILRETGMSGCYKILGDTFIAGPPKDVDPRDVRVLGTADSLHWVEWDIQDQEIYLC